MEFDLLSIRHLSLGTQKTKKKEKKRRKKKNSWLMGCVCANTLSHCLICFLRVAWWWWWCVYHHHYTASTFSISIWEQVSCTLGCCKSLTKTATCIWQPTVVIRTKTKTKWHLRWVCLMVSSCPVSLPINWWTRNLNVSSGNVEKKQNKYFNFLFFMLL